MIEAPQKESTSSRKLDRVPHTRHRPEETLLYQIVEKHYPAFLDHLENEGRRLPRHVRKEFEAYLKCGRLEHGFLRHRCENCHDERFVALSCKSRGFCPSCAARRMVDSAALLVDEILPAQPLRQWVLTLPIPLRFLCANDSRTVGALLGIAYRAISTFLIKQAGRKASEARCGSVTLIQRFGSGLNLNIHFHMLFLDGIYVVNPSPGDGRGAGGEGSIEFHRLPPPSPQQVEILLDRISRRFGRWLEKRGLLERDMEGTHLTNFDSDDSAFSDLQAQSLTYRIALGPRRGSKAFTIQNAPPQDPSRSDYPVARTANFSLHAGLVVEDNQRGKLEHLCRYITRPPMSLERLTQMSSGALSYRLKNPWKNGTTELIYDPLEFIGKLIALVPSPRTHLTRYHGVFAPHSALRAHITPAGRGSRPIGPMAPNTPGAPKLDEKHRPMNWAERLKRVFGIEANTCNHCEGAIKLLSYIGNADLIHSIVIRLQTPFTPKDPAHYPQGPPEHQPN